MSVVDGSDRRLTQPENPIRVRRTSTRWLTWAALLLGVATLFAWQAASPHHLLRGDWGFFLLGARTLVHYHGSSFYGGGRLSVYANNPDLQIGPPALWSVAAAQGLSVRVAENLFAALIAALGVVAVMAGEYGARRHARHEKPAAGITLPIAAAGVVTTSIWAYEGARWMHLDDALALAFVAIAIAMIHRERLWWLVSILLGSAAASKPWALIFVPVLLVLPRDRISKSVLLMIATAAAWWLPFIVAAPDTISALGQFQIIPTTGSVIHLLGAHRAVGGWLRPTQFVLGIAIGAVACRRHGLTSAPLAALAVRVMTDPYSFSYYGLGPLLFAYVFDCGSSIGRRIPLVTATTALVEFGLPWLGVSPTVAAVAKLAWALVMLLVIFVGRGSLRSVGEHLRSERGLGVRHS